jgi:hypothetical protein
MEDIHAKMGDFQTQISKPEFAIKSEKVDQILQTHLKMKLNDILFEKQNPDEIFELARKCLDMKLLRPHSMILLFEELFESCAPSMLEDSFELFCRYIKKHSVFEGITD